MAPRDGINKNKKSKLIKDTEQGYTARKHRKESAPTTESTVIVSQEETTTPPSQPIQTLSGGVSLIFSMARRMLLWDNEEYYHQQYNDASPTTSDSSMTLNFPPLPKWRPYEGIADLNPSFRSEAPVMNNIGYARILRRNSRKKGPSLWRYTLRIYNKMKEIEIEQTEQRLIISQGRNDDDGDDNNGGGGIDIVDPFWIQRKTEHFEAALVACAKLGLFREAMKIYQDALDLVLKAENDTKRVMPLVNGTVVYPNSQKIKRLNDNQVTKITKNKYKDTGHVRVTQNMILSLVKACVRQRNINTVEKIQSLDQMSDILDSLKEKYDITVEAKMVNPIAAAYVKFGYLSKALDMMDRLLSSPKSSSSSSSGEEEDGTDIDISLAYDDTSAALLLESKNKKSRSKYTNEDSFIEPTPLNLSEINSKDQSSYKILIEAALIKGDYSSAIETLREMTRNGYYPNSRSMNIWNEL